jgi:hypothetical protein
MVRAGGCFRVGLVPAYREWVRSNHEHSGRFVTFDGTVPLSAVRSAGKDHLSVI